MMPYFGAGNRSIGHDGPSLRSWEREAMITARYSFLITIFMLLTGDAARDAFGQGRIGMANPASVYCVQSGYTLEIRTDDKGGQRGVCIFPDGAECEEWAFFRGECGVVYRNMPDMQSETIRSEHR